MERTSVYLADRQELFREGMHFILSSEEDIQVIGETTSNEEALRFIESNLPDVAILNINHGEPSGTETTKLIKQNHPSVSVILAMDVESEENLFSAMKSGASACITRDIEANDLIKTVRDVAKGAKPIGNSLLIPTMASRVLKEFEALSLAADEVKDMLADLTTSEADVLRHVAEGTPGEQLAVALNIPEEVVNLYLSLILLKLATNCQRWGLIEAAQRRSQLISQKRLSQKPGAEQAKPRDWIAWITAIFKRPAVKESPTLVPEGKAAEVPVVVVTPPSKADVPPTPEAIRPKIVSAPPIPAAEPEPVPEVTSATIWQSAEVTKLLECLATGKLVELNPEINLALEDGFAYPEVDKITETSGRATVQILESLAEEEILTKKLFEKLLLSPEGSAQIIPVENCPHCDSSDIVKGQVIEHYTCGYVGPESDFKVGLKYICPKCRKELKLIGTDYRNLGPSFFCSECSESFPAPITKFRSLRTGDVYTRDELQEVWLYSYRFNEDKKSWLDFQLKPKARLIGFLKHRGYKVEEMARITGRSGAVHTLDILASRDDTIARHLIAVGIFAVKPGETQVAIDELLNFKAKTDEVGIHDRVVVAIPELTPEAQKFAEAQQIKVLKVEDLMSLSVDSPGLSHTRQAGHFGSSQA